MNAVTKSLIAYVANPETLPEDEVLTKETEPRNGEGQIMRSVDTWSQLFLKTKSALRLLSYMRQ